MSHHTVHASSIPIVNRTVRIRPYQEEDRKFVLDLTSRLTTGMPAWRSREKMAATMHRYALESIENTRPDEMVFVAVDEREQQLGFISVRHNVNFTGEIQAFIGELVVSVEAEGHGVGHALMEAAEHWARSRGYSIIVLETGAENTHARAFYEHRGYLNESVRLAKLL